MSNTNDFYKSCVGLKKNKLTLIKYLGKDRNGKPRFNAICDCGKNDDNIDYYLWRDNLKCDCKDCAKKRKSESSRKKIIIGEKYGRFTPIKELPHEYGEPIKYQCLCDCGNPEPIILSTGELGRKEKNNAGCWSCRQLHLEGQTFGRLLVLQKDPNDNKKWLCKCNCGNKNIVSVLGCHLVDGHTKSCGCFKIERTKEVKKNYNTFDMSNSEYGICLMSNGSFIFDKEDYEMFNEFVWHITNYNIVTRYQGKEIYASTLLFPDIDQRRYIIRYKNKNTFDLRKSNLEITTYSERNLKKVIQSNNKSGIIGVTQNRSGSWRASLTYQGELITKCFKEFKDAVVYRLQLEKDYIGEEYAPQRHLFEQYNI